MRNAFATRGASACRRRSSSTPRVRRDWVRSEHIALGGNVRASATYVDVPNQDSTSEFDIDEARVYLLLEPIPQRLSLYIDERVAPGSADNRELWAQFWWSDRSWYVKAGQLYLPYGLRLEDDTAFVRQVPGINMTTPDRASSFGFGGST